MKIVCQRDGLLAACQRVSSAVAERTTKPTLADCKAIAQDDALILMATDLEVGIRYELRGVQVKRPGTALLPPNRLLKILKASSDADISIDVGEEKTTIKLSSGRYELPNGSPEEFPDIPSFDTGVEYHEVTAGVLRTLIKRTDFAADKRESSRFAVKGILWEAEEDKLRLVATDTRRLALCEGKAESHGTPSDTKGQSHLVSLKAISLLERNLTDDRELVRVVLKPNEAMFQTERALIHTRLVEGRFPPYKTIIPKSAKVKLPITTANFLDRVHQAAIMIDKESKQVDFHFETGKVVLSTHGAEIGESEVTLDLPDYSGDELDIAFDPSYLIEMLRAIDGEPTAILEMTDGKRPAVFKLGEDYLYLVKPLTG